MSAEPRSPHLLVAEGLARQGRVGAAVEECWQAVQADPDDPFARSLMAGLMLAGDFYDEAISEATLAIEADPDCSPAYLALGLAYDRRGGMWDQSILVWHELAEVVPDLVTARVQLGEAFAAANFDEEAVEAWEAALELDPREHRAIYDLAIAALRREGVATALPGFRKAGELDPSQDELFFDLIGVTRRLAAMKLPADPPEDAAARVRLGGVLAYREDLFGALDAARAALDAGPEDADALALAAFTYLKQEADNEAAALALRALSLRPEHAPSMYVLGVAYSRRAGLDRHAAGVFARLLQWSWAHPMPHVLLAECYLGMQRYSKAETSYRCAIELDPACVRARFGLAAACLTQGRHAEASWEVRRAAYYDTEREGLFWKLYDAYVEGRS